MKKYYFLIIVALILGLVLTGCSLLSNVGQVPTTDQGGVTCLTKSLGNDLFIDDFESYSIGTLTSTDWENVSGTSSIVLDTTKVLDITGGNYVGEAVAVTGSPDWQDYILDLDAKKCSGSYFNIVFRYVNPGTYYMVESPSDSAHIALFKRVDGDFTQLVLPRPEQPTVFGTWYHYRIELLTTPTGTNIKVFVNGVEKFDIIDDTPALAMGSVGVGGYDSKSHFDNVVVQYWTIVINGCDTGVADTFFEYKSETKRISEHIEDIYFEAKNHGQFVRGVALLTNVLMKAGIITGEEKGKIQSCAAQANQLPKEHGLVLWLDAGKGITEPVDGELVSEWKDQSGNDNNATQGEANNQPTYVINWLNEQPVVRFDGNNDFLITDNVSLGDSISVFAVVEAEDKMSPNPHDWRYNQGIVTQYKDGRYILEINSTATVFQFYDGPELPRWITATAEATSWQLYGAIREYGLTNRLYLNGMKVNSQNTSVGTPGSTNPIKIGFSGDYFRYLKGDIAEILVYNRALSDSERGMVENYLKYKYNL